MLVYCYKCFTLHRFDNVIPTGGKRLQCNKCGYEYTLFPSKVIIGEFHDYVIYHTDLSGRALSTIFHNVSSVNQFFQLTRRDFLNFRNCPDGHFKIPHLWPGQNPPPEVRFHPWRESVLIL